VATRDDAPGLMLELIVVFLGSAPVITGVVGTGGVKVGWLASVVATREDAPGLILELIVVFLGSAPVITGVVGTGGV